MNKYCICFAVVILLVTRIENSKPVNKKPVIQEESPIVRQYTGTRFIATVTPTPIPTQTPMPTHTPTLIPTIGPFGDTNGNPAPAPRMYPFADADWRDFASHIVAGETGNSPQARRVVACTLVRDVLNGWEPYNLRKRWYAWKEPEWLDRLAVWNALFENGCDGLPWYRYVGNENDRLIWISKGMMTHETPYDVYGKTIGVR